MNKFRTAPVEEIEKSVALPTTLSDRIGEIMLSSSTVRARVEALNPQSGEYRVVLQGVLLRESAHGDD